MRPLYKNDIIRISKPITEIKQYSVYFLILKKDIVYIGYSQTPYSRILHHLTYKKFDRYHILNFENQGEALAAETLYIKNFKPTYNTTHNDEAQRATSYKYQPPIIDPVKPPVEVKVQPITKVPPRDKNLILSTDKINLLNNNYIKKDGNIYLKIDNTLFRMPNDVMFGKYKNVLYRKPTKLFGNIMDIIILDIP